MEKLFKRIIIAVFTMTMLLAFTAQAANSVVVTPRDSMVSSTSVEITNETGGNIGVCIQTVCNVEATQIRNTAILEKMVDGSWEEIVRHTYTANKADFPNTTLYTLMNEFTVKNQETDYYYRVRGVHQVTVNGTTRSYSSVTDGLRITEYK